MDQNLNKKLTLKEYLVNFFNNNRFTIIFIILLLLISIFSIIILKENKKKENVLLSEKYVKAGILLSEKQNKKAKSLLEDIIFTGSSFYSILSLNTILEKNLVTDKNKILKYFDAIENLNLHEENTDLIKFKKALYLIKSQDILRGKKILKNLIEEDSSLKLIAEEILKN